MECLTTIGPKVLGLIFNSYQKNLQSRLSKSISGSTRMRMRMRNIRANLSRKAVRNSN